MVELWDNAETLASAEVPRFSIDIFFVHDDGAYDGPHSSGIKVEQP